MRRFFCHALQTGKSGLIQAVDIRQSRHQILANQLLNELIAQAFHIHGAAAGEMADGALQLRRASQATCAAAIGLARFALGGATANWTMRGHSKYLRAFRAFIQQHTHHLRNHIACTAHDDGIAHAHILAPRFVFVMQSGVGHGHAADKNGRKFGHRREFASAPNLHIYAQDRG